MRLHINLKEVMKERGITQTELSAMSNVTQAKISNLCNNKMQELNIGILERIATALEIEDISILMQFKK
ncbi:helix-turn-helix transcriptional regulator [Paenibacillus sp. LK1]|uniref:helix-turn-helix domain-containing protein n=1 Tax=Paenibacillus sp. LK1 TaxID=2053014 RepID=UPI000C178326|nr:helix-turn-helix transcriptional regulator [Paenibacillus sp. LK1]PIH55335.1 transcriptional regulator [Paenibacillus sp. LK1]